MKLFEMEGFLRGKCLPGDMKVNETNAEYLVRKFTELEQKLAESQREFRAADATIENLQMQVEKLAAENAGLKAANAEGCKWDGEQWVGISIETPATDAFMDEVRAQGVEMFAAWNDKHIKPGVEHKESLTAVSHAARGLAEQIRKGVQP